MKPLFYFFLILSLFAIHCHKTPTQSADDLVKEAERIPWEQLSGQIVYSRFEDGDGSLFLIDAAQREVRLVKKSAGTQFSNLAWKKDGVLIAYSGIDASRNRWQIFTIDRLGTSHNIVYSVAADNDFPAWSPENKLAYWVYGAPGQRYQIWVDNAPFYQEAVCNQTRPAWSPDSLWMAISLQDSASSGSLYKIHLETREQVLIQQAFHGQLIYHPIFSPNGQQIAYTLGTPVPGANSEIWIINADGSDPRRITTGHQDWYPAWSPDGNSLIFCRGVGFNARLFLINPANGNPQQITVNPASYPSWID